MAMSANMVEVTLRGNVGGGAGDYARSKVEAVLEDVEQPVLRVHVVLDWRRDPAVERPAVAETGVDVDGMLVRAQAVRPTMTEAVDEMAERLRHRIRQSQARVREQHRWTALAEANEWRHGDLPRPATAYFPRPVGEREVVRHKSLASEPMTVDEAAYEMDLLDHGFFLFSERDTRQPVLIRRRGDGRYGVSSATPASGSATVVLEPGPPTLSDREARERLEAGGEPHVFYLEPVSGEARVLYLRYDGDYGLISLG